MINLSNKKLFIFDLDGTVYNDNLPNPGAIDFINTLFSKNIPYYFYSNNSSNTCQYYTSKLNRMGINAQKEQIIISTYDAALWLHHNKINKLYIMGTKEMKDELKNLNIEHSPTDNQFILMGYDKELTYEKISEVAILLQEEKKLLMTHCDIACPSQKGLLPDIGAILKMFQAVINVKPIRVFGKPNPNYVNALIQHHKLQKEHVVIIGDRIQTDIQMAKNVGCTGILVLTGVTNICQAKKFKIPIVINHLSQLTI